MNNKLFIFVNKSLGFSIRSGFLLYMFKKLVR